MQSDISRAIAWPRDFLINVMMGAKLVLVEGLIFGAESA